MKVIIVGGGQVGAFVARTLLDENHEVMIIEQHPVIFEHLEQEFPKDILLFDSGSNPEVLEKAGIAQVDAIAAITGQDEVNLVVSTLAKFEFGVPRVVARVNNPKNEWLFTPLMGVDHRVNQAEIMAQKIVHEDILTEE